MNFLKQLFKILIIYLIVLSSFVAFILYLRPDLKLIDFKTNPTLWIVPVALLYITLNFKRLFSSILNKVLILVILAWGAYHFFPDYTKKLFNMAKDELPSQKEITKQTNKLLTPSNGEQPVFQFEIPKDNTRKKQKINAKQEVNQQYNNEPSPLTPEEEQNKNERASVDSPGQMAQEFANETLNKVGIEVPNSRQPLDNLDKKKSNIQDSFFK